MEFFHKVSTFPFMHTRRRWYAVSVVAVLASIVLVIVRPLNWGIEFTGGVMLEYTFPQAVDTEKARAALEKAGINDAQLQRVDNPRDILVRSAVKQNKDIATISNEVTAAMKTLDPAVVSQPPQFIGGQVGKELSEQGGLAVMMTFILIGIYTWFRFQWKMGVSAVVATLHDPIIIVGFFSATQIPVDLAVLAAILAVIGYSLNDTVVVFDRVRENFRAMREADPEAILDASINQTLSRTVITSGATLLVVVVLLLLGGSTLEGFSWALTFGIIVGTYSSIYVAGALSLELKISARDLMPAQKHDKELDALP